MENLRFEERDGVGLITLSRPKVLNALNSALLAELDALLVEIADKGLSALVITGEGRRAFAAGADIAEMKDMDAAEAEAFAARGQAVFTRLESFPAPTIAAVNGFAMGGGCELALATDIILAGPNAVFAQPEVKLGVIPGFGGTVRLSRRVGQQRALEILLSGRNVSADEAARIGLALSVVSEGEVLDAALALAQRIAANGPVAVRLVKRSVITAVEADVQRGLSTESKLFAQCFETADQKEGMDAFLSKRPPNFTGQ